MSQKILKKRKKMVSSAMNHLKKLSGSSWAQGKHFFKSLISGKVFALELVSKELNHFGVIAGLFRQIGGHSSM